MYMGTGNNSNKDLACADMCSGTMWCTWAQANNSTRVWHVLICVVDNMVCMGTGNNSNKTWHVLICVVDNVVCMGTGNNSSKTWHVLICLLSNNIEALSWKLVELGLGVVLPLVKL